MLQVNATLTALAEASAAAGERDDWDDPGVEPAGGAAAKWAGELDAYYREKVDRVADNGTVNVFTRRTLWIDAAAARETGIDTNDVITFTYKGAERTGQAIAVAIADLDGMDDVATCRIDLEPA